MKMKLDILGFLAGKLVIPRCSAVIVASGNSTRMKGIDKVMTEISWAADDPSHCRRVPEACGRSGDRRRDERRPSGARCRAAQRCWDDESDGGGGWWKHEDAIGRKWTGPVCKKSKLIAVHDGARPLISQEIITAVLSKGRANRRRRAGIAGERYDPLCRGRHRRFYAGAGKTLRHADAAGFRRGSDPCRDRAGAPAGSGNDR